MDDFKKGETFKNICIGLGALAVPIVVVLLGNQIQSFVQEKEIQGKYVEIAVGILQNPKSVASPELRGWAVGVIDNYSGVPLSKGVSEELIQKGLPDFQLSVNASAQVFTWGSLREEDRDKLWGDDHIWSCYVVSGNKVTCFPYKDTCLKESKKAKSSGENVIRPCGSILHSSDGW